MELTPLEILKAQEKELAEQEKVLVEQLALLKYKKELVTTPKQDYLPLRTQLLSMGYRSTNEDLWCKPIGFSALVINLSSSMMILCNVSRLQNTLLLWDSIDLDLSQESSSLIDQIKGAEVDMYLSTKGMAYVQTNKDYSFLSIEQELSHYLNED